MITGSELLTRRRRSSYQPPVTGLPSQRRWTLAVFAGIVTLLVGLRPPFEQLNVSAAVPTSPYYEHEVTEETLASHVDRMEDADCVVDRVFVDGTPRTTYRFTDHGERVFEDRIRTLESLVGELETDTPSESART